MIMENVTPMMRQYLEIKEKHSDCILFFRLGDFYEMFFDDALIVTRELEITLTGKECGLEERAPMCGVPFHAADTYISKLVEKGYKVAICEQVEDPKEAKGLVKRDVIRIVTPGTVIEGNTLRQGKNNYIVSIVFKEGIYGLSICDVSTGEWRATEIEEEGLSKKLLDELAKYDPVECILDDVSYECEPLKEFIKNRFGAILDQMPAHYLDNDLAHNLLTSHFNILGLEGIGLIPNTSKTLAVASLLAYLKDTQKNTLAHMQAVDIYNINAYMLLDVSTRRNLELTETLREKKRKGSLLWVLDHTQTAMGSRYLRRCIEQPLIYKESIEKRLEATEELKDNLFLKEDLTAALYKIYDIERLVSKIAYATCNAKDLIALKLSLEKLPIIKELLQNTTSHRLKELYEDFDPLLDLYKLIEEAIALEPPISLREGGLIKEGYHEEVDHLRTVKKQGTDWLRDIEMKEREKTGIKNLKIKYNKVFGYFLEVTNSYSNLVPDYFIRKQTLANCERYITEELKKIEDEVLGADDKLTTLEYNLFTKVREEIALHIDRLLAVARALAELDMYSSFADVAYKNNYIKPQLITESCIHIKGSRHPVVEKIMGEHTFIANDVYLDDKSEQINLITGPNMAGKSTFMRQVALVVLMAQIGSFVPAEEASIGVVDRIFTRVGASDDLASGQSTFMVEMMEVSNILNNATKNSLLILDEIGRGTSTIDGLSIAWSIIEHIANKNVLGAKTLFATHYHELTSLEETLLGLKNYCVSVKEAGEDIIFLHKIIPGSVDHSYGIQVAKLAGLPTHVLERAREIMRTLEGEAQKELKRVEVPKVKQLSLFENTNQEKVLKELKEIDVMDLTPMKALQMLYDLQKQLKQ